MLPLFNLISSGNGPAILRTTEQFPSRRLARARLREKYLFRLNPDNPYIVRAELGKNGGLIEFENATYVWEIKRNGITEIFPHLLRSLLKPFSRRKTNGRA